MMAAGSSFGAIASGAGGAIAKRRVWALGVVVIAPAFDDDLGLLQAVEDFAIEALVPEFSVEGLAIAILPGRARLDVKALRSQAGQPLPEHLCDHLGAVI